MPTFCDDVPHSHNAADDSQAALYSSCAAAAVAGVVPGQLPVNSVLWTSIQFVRALKEWFDCAIRSHLTNKQLTNFVVAI